MSREPDVELHTRVRAAELRFEAVPDVEVASFADHPASVERTREREHLPDAVEPGVTYRDVEVRWGIAVRLEDE